MAAKSQDRKPNVYRRGAILTDGRNEWEIVTIDKAMIWVKQSGTLTVPFPVAVCDRLRILGEE